MTDQNVFVMAGGTGVIIPYLNTIEKKVSKSIIISALESENKNILNTSGSFDISSLTELFIIEDEEVK